MAIDFSVYTETVCSGLKADHTYMFFLISVKRNKKLKRKTLDYSKKGWTKRDRERNAKKELQRITEQLEFVHAGNMPTVEGYWQRYLKTLPHTSWTKTKERHFEKYLKKCIGKKRLNEVIAMHIKECMAKQEREGMAPRTVNTTLEILRPMFKDAAINRLIEFSPCDGLKVKLPKTKKIVTDASLRLSEIYAVIMDEFSGDPFYRALYLFALMGRRKGEILNLRWEDVSFSHGYVVLSDTKNDEIQKMFLPDIIKESLLEFYDNEKTGWVFVSPFDPKEHISNIEKTTMRIKKRLPFFTLHYLRNVIVSAMAEHGLAAVNMSGALGHMSANTIDKYLSLNYLQGSKSASDTITKIISCSIL